MNIINEITAGIVKKAKNGESIYSLASKVGFAYSAVYNWVLELEKYGVISLIRKGNKSIIKVNKNIIYKKFRELEDAVSVIEKDRVFWDLIKNLKLKVRFARGTAAAIWTQGSFLTGDFYDKIYFLEAEVNDIDKLKKALTEKEIAYTEDKISSKRPLVYIDIKKKLKIDKKNGLPIMPLSEFVQWCKDLELDNILEQLNLLYGLKLKVKYAEVFTNA